MIGGAAQADVGVLVISARQNEFEAGFDRGGQTSEHAVLAKTLGTTHTAHPRAAVRAGGRGLTVCVVCGVCVVRGVVCVLCLCAVLCCAVLCCAVCAVLCAAHRHFPADCADQQNGRTDR